MKISQLPKGTSSLEPFEHDCSSCQWIGWHTEGEELINVYLCQPKGHIGSLIFRYSSEPSDYSSMCLIENDKGEWKGGGVKGGIGISEGIMKMYQKEEEKP